MNYLFIDCVWFNQDLGQWDVKNVNTFYSCFSGCLNYQGHGLDSWFENNSIEFINSIPSYNQKADFVSRIEKGDFIDQFNVQLIDLVENKEGGLFLFLGKKIKK